MSAEALRLRAQRLRALLARLERPLAALEHITRAADAHLDALAPELALLEAAPFQNMGVFDTERRPVTADERRAARRVLEPPVPQVRSAAGAAAAAPPQQNVAAAAATPPAPARFAARVLPPTARVPATAAAPAAVLSGLRANHEAKKYTLERLQGLNRTSEFVSTIQRALADAATAVAQQEREPETGQRVDFAALVGRASHKSSRGAEAERAA
jgi:hypothetical protein